MKVLGSQKVHSQCPQFEVGKGRLRQKWKEKWGDCRLELTWKQTMSATITTANEIVFVHDEMLGKVALLDHNFPIFPHLF